MRCSFAQFSAATPIDPIVFIVNSDQPTRDWIEATVTTSGLRAMSFARAGDLLSRYDGGVPACAILDLSLADANGFEVQEKLADVGAAVLFVTHERSISSCVRAIKAGAVDFLTMPCDALELVQSLRAAVREALRRRAVRDRQRQLEHRYATLTRREREVFALVTTGMLNKQIAEQLDIGEITVQVHRGRAMRKMRAHSLADLVRMADALQLHLRRQNRGTHALTE